MFVDDIKIKVEAGHGGHGAVAFNKNLMSLGPTGARGVGLAPGPSLHAGHLSKKRYLE